MELGPKSRALGGRHCFCPRLTSWRPHGMARRFHLSFLFLPICHFFGAHPIFWGQAWAEGKRGAACNVPPRADSRRETHIKKCAAIV